jgi:hypothetical protein
MKKVINLFAAFALIALVAACSKDDEGSNGTNNPTVTNELKIGSTTYVLKTGVIEDYGTDSSSYEGTNFDIYLLSDGVTLDANGEPQGNGFGMYFESFSADAGGIKSGTYTFSSSLAVNTFDIGQVVKIENGNPVSGYTVTSGSYVVDNKGNNRYKISGTLTTMSSTAQQTTITFSYDGTFTVN